MFLSACLTSRVNKAHKNRIPNENISSKQAVTASGHLNVFVLTNKNRRHQEFSRALSQSIHKVTSLAISSF